MGLEHPTEDMTRCLARGRKEEVQDERRKGQEEEKSAERQEECEEAEAALMCCEGAVSIILLGLSGREATRH